VEQNFEIAKRKKKKPLNLVLLILVENNNKIKILGKLSLYTVRIFVSLVTGKEVKIFWQNHNWRRNKKNFENTGKLNVLDPYIDIWRENSEQLHV